MSASMVEISGLQINHDSRMTAWEPIDVTLRHPKYNRFRESEETAVMVFLDIDSNLDEVLGDLGASGDVESLTRVIAALELVRDALATNYGDAERYRGRCFAQSGWGRCYGNSGHEGKHNFPDPPKDYPSDPSDYDVWEGSPVR